MTAAARAPRPSRARGPAGYALLVVLMLLGLIGMLGATYLRHVVFEGQRSITGSAAQDASAAVDSGLAWARQSIVVNGGLTETSVTNGLAAATVDVTELGDEHHAVFAQSLDENGVGATLLAESVRLNLPLETVPDELPKLTATVLDPLHGSSASALHYYSGTQLVQNADLTGILVIRNGARITFDNVTLQGAIVSESVLSDAPLGAFNTSTAPRVILDGGLRITSGSVLPGVALLMPDGLVTCTSGPCSLQVLGDVVAHSLTLTGIGSIEGNIATVDDLSLPSTIERPGYGRLPQAWSASLALGDAYALQLLAFPPRESTIGELSGITEFEFP
jgi:hypothetical protein